eukprot:356913-Chlamydomonas_euryale.AAC.6
MATRRQEMATRHRATATRRRTATARATVHRRGKHVHAPRDEWSCTQEGRGHAWQVRRMGTQGGGKSCWQCLPAPAGSELMCFVCMHACKQAHAFCWPACNRCW